MRLLAIDPGASTGWALFANGALVQCGVADIDEWMMPSEFDHLIIEIPQITPQTPNWDNIVTLALNAGRWIERSGLSSDRITQVHPARWKGQVPKAVHHPRILARLSSGERANIPKLGSKKAQGDMMDAIGIGLWYAGRKA